MSKRYDRLTDTTVLVAERRRQRPHDWNTEARGLHVTEETAGSAEDCPFCRGHEQLTEQPRLALDKEGTQLAPEASEWVTRVVDNKFPVAEPGEDSNSAATPAAPRVPEFARLTPARALHEVVIATPRHRTRLSALDANDWRRMFIAWALRLERARALDFDYGSAFLNYGSKAGASLAHLHGQVLAIDEVPPRVQTMTRAFASYDDEHSRCLMCDRLDDLSVRNDRVIVSGESAVSFAPFASRFPFEICVSPRRHQTDLDSGQSLSAASAFRGVASTLATTLRKLSDALDDPPLNLMLQTAPLSGSTERFHWHLVVLPALSRGAGFEWSTGWHVNPVAPETVASRLKNLDPSSDDDR